MWLFLHRDLLNGYSCTCLAGYTGRNCETNIDDCQHQPCRHGGSCIDLVNDYKCVCRLPHTGRDCESKLDPCSPNRSVIFHYSHRFLCHCIKIRFNKNCNIFCYRCRNGARCTPSTSYLDFSCACSLGYTGRLCQEDVDECAISSPCRNGATCRNTNGSYACICATGYLYIFICIL